MGCPSLLYLSSPADRIPFAAPSVFTDLMLQDLLPEPVRAVLQTGTEPAEIPARQEIFCQLEQNAALSQSFQALARSAADLARLLRRYDALGADPGADMVFVHLAGEFLHFLDLAQIDAPRGSLLSGFDAYVRARRDDPQTELLRRACRNAPRWDNCVLRLRTVDASIRINRADDVRWEESLEADLAAMGLPPSPAKPKSWRQMNSAFTAGLAKLRPEEYEICRNIRERFAPYLFSEETDIRSLPSLSEEIGFYASVHSFADQLRGDGFILSLPELRTEREISLKGVQDISLRRRGLRGEEVIANDLQLSQQNGDNFFWLTGANGGGKTVYLRAAGIAMLLAVSGCPVPCSGGSFAHFDRLMTHFPLNEDFRDTGRFDEEKRRADEIASAASPTLIALLNETFSGTDEAKSAASSQILAETLHQSGAFGIYVTHLHELTGGDIPTLAAVVDESDENRRTYRIVRQRRTDSSHAADILFKYALTRQQLAERRRRLGKE